MGFWGRQAVGIVVVETYRGHPQTGPTSRASLTGRLRSRRRRQVLSRTLEATGTHVRYDMNVGLSI